MSRLPISRWYLAVPVTVLALPAVALDLTLEANHTAEYSTNIGRTTSSSTEDEDEGWIQQPGATLSAVHEAPNITLSGDYDARRRIYDNDSQDDDTVVTGSAALEWRALPKRLTFDVSNSRTEATIDSRGTFAPDNRQVTSNTSAGATLRVESFGSHFMNFGYRYDVSTADETDSDSKSQNGVFAYVVSLSATRSVQLNGSVSDVDFDDDLSPDYTQYSGNLQYQTTGPTVDFDGAVGYTTIDRELQRDDASGMTGNATLTWHHSDVTATTVSYARSYDSQSDRLGLGIPEVVDGEIRDNSDLNEVFVSDSASVTFVTEVGRNRISLGAGYVNRDYEDVAADDEATTASLSIERHIRPTVTGTLFTGISRTEFDVDGRQDDDWNSGVTVAWTGFRRLSLSVSGTYFERSSDESTDEYDEWRGLIRIGYRLIGPR